MVIYELWEPEKAPKPRRQLEHRQGWWCALRRGLGGMPIASATDTWGPASSAGSTRNESNYPKNAAQRGCVQLRRPHQLRGNLPGLQPRDVRNYRRSLNINEAIAWVCHETDGVTYTREHFLSYPDKVMVVRLAANKKGALSFVLRPEIPYLEKQDRRTDTIRAKADLLTLSGAIPFFNRNYEGQIKVLTKAALSSLTAQRERSRSATQTPSPFCRHGNELPT